MIEIGLRKRYNHWDKQLRQTGPVTIYIPINAAQLKLVSIYDYKKVPYVVSKFSIFFRVILWKIKL